MELKFSGKQDVYIEIAERYKEYIRLGVIGKDEKLPSVREAAVELGVNPNTVARAYAKLESDGYIKSLPKKGAYVIYGSDKANTELDKRNVIYALHDMGIGKATVLKWIEEVYGNDD